MGGGGGGRRKWLLETNKLKGGKKNRGKYIKKNGEKGLKNASFWLINLKNSREKIFLSRGGGMIEMHNIYPWGNYKISFRLCGSRL